MKLNEKHGNQCKSMVRNGTVLESMEKHENQWKIMKINEKHEINGKAWDPMGKHENQ